MKLISNEKFEYYKSLEKLLNKSIKITDDSQNNFDMLRARLESYRELAASQHEIIDKFNDKYKLIIHIVDGLNLHRDAIEDGLLMRQTQTNMRLREIAVGALQNLTVDNITDAKKALKSYAAAIDWLKSTVTR